MASKVDIANFALNIIGATTISSLTENVKAATVINQRFDSVRDAVFRAHPWNSLINRASFSQDTTSQARQNKTRQDTRQAQHSVILINICCLLIQLV